MAIRDEDVREKAMRIAEVLAEHKELIFDLSVLRCYYLSYDNKNEKLKKDIEVLDEYISLMCIAGDDKHLYN